MDSAFLFNPDGCGLRCHAPSLLTTRSGTVLAVWYAYEEDEHVGARLVLSRKRQGSSEWDRSAVVPARSPYSVGNPVLFEDEISGAIWLFFAGLKGGHWNEGELQGASSTDDGHTWSEPETVWASLGLMIRHPPIPTRDGALLLPAYDEQRRQALLLRRSDRQGGWQEAYRFDDPPLLQPALVRDSPARLSLFFRPWSDPRVIWRSHSLTEGLEWSTPVRTALPCPLSGLAAFALPGRVVLVYNHTEEHARTPLSLSVSRDGGLSWDPPWHFENVRCEVSYPQFLACEDGGAHGVYSYNRRVIKYVRFDRSEIR